MKRLLVNILSLTALTMLPASVTTAGPHHFHPPPPHPKHFHYKPPPPHHFHHKYHHSKYYWGHFGLGLVTGAVIAKAVTPPPPPPRAVVYASPPPVIIQSTNGITYSTTQDVQQPKELVLRLVKTTPELLNVRSGPNIKESITGQLGQGEVLHVIGAAPDWLYIKTADGQYGWVLSQYTREMGGPVG